MAGTGDARNGGGQDPPKGGAERPADSAKGTEGAGAPAAGGEAGGGCAPAGYRCVCTCVPPKEAVLPDAGELPPADPPPPDTGGGTPTLPGGENPEPPPASATPGAPGLGTTLGPSPGASIDTGGPLSSWPWRQPGAWTAPGAPGNGAGSGLGAGIRGGAARARIPRIIPSRSGPPAAVAHPAAVASFAGPQQDEASLGTALEDPTAAGPGPEEPWLVFPGDSTRSTRLLRFPDRLPVAPPFAGVFDLWGAWGSRDSGPGAVAGPGTEDGSERAGLWRESSMPVLAPPRFDGEGVRDLTEDRQALGVEAPPGTPTAPSDRVDGDDPDLDGDAMEPGWGGDGGSQAEEERGAPLSAGLPAGPVVGSRPGPARPWEEGLIPCLPAVAPASPPAGIHAGAGPAGAAALLGRGSPSGGLPPSPRPSARPGVFAKPTLGKGGGSYEAARRAADDAMESQTGRRYGKDQTLGVVQALEMSGASDETVDRTAKELNTRTHQAFDAMYAAEQKALDNFSSKEQAWNRLAEADARYEKSREREDRKYAAMPNGAEARRANQAARTARYARDTGTSAKRALAKNRKNMSPKQYREAKKAVKEGREAPKAAKKAARVAKYAARNGPDQHAKEAAEKAERLAALAVATAVKAKEEAEKKETNEEVESTTGSPAGEVPDAPGIDDGEDTGGKKGDCEEKNCGTCDTPCDADQECVCTWEKEVASPRQGGESEDDTGGVKGKGAGGGATLDQVSLKSRKDDKPDQSRKSEEVSPIESLVVQMESSDAIKGNSKHAADLRRLLRALKALARKDTSIGVSLERVQRRVDRLLEKGRSSGPLSGGEKYQLLESLKLIMALTAAKDFMGDLAAQVTAEVAKVTPARSSDKRERVRLERELAQIRSMSESALGYGQGAVRRLMAALRYGSPDLAMSPLPQAADPIGLLLSRMVGMLKEVPSINNALVNGGLTTVNDVLRAFGVHSRIVGAISWQGAEPETLEARMKYEDEVGFNAIAKPADGLRPDDWIVEEVDSQQDRRIDAAGEEWEQQKAESLARDELTTMAQATIRAMNEARAEHSMELEWVVEDTSPIVQVIDLDQWEEQQLVAWQDWYFSLPHPDQVRILSERLDASREEMNQATLDYAKMIGVEGVKAYLGGVAFKYGMAGLSRAYKAIAVAETGAAGTRAIAEIAKGSSRELLGLSKTAFPGKSIEVSAFRFEGLPPIKGGGGGRALQALSSEAETKVVDLIRASDRHVELAKVAIRAEQSGKVVRTSIDAVARSGTGDVVAIEVKRLSAFMEGLGMTKNQLKVYPKLVEGIAEAYGKRAGQVELLGSKARTLELYIVRKNMIWRVTVTSPIM